ncbi:hypothetical protein [Nostoc sp. PA-18-2419]|uniref:hypothetical protein n=1 Tax=Nostoc sp. PA-18-2419 TaxID=2575443 RepID=UPI001109F38F|nr:hypothetical protein [Nostoc sp. PA-18-2419]
MYPPLIEDHQICIFGGGLYPNNYELRSLLLAFGEYYELVIIWSTVDCEQWDIFYLSVPKKKPLVFLPEVKYIIPFHLMFVADTPVSASA